MVSVEKKDAERPWNLPLIGPFDPVNFRLPDYDFLTKFNTQIFIGTTMEIAKSKASAFHKIYNTLGLSEVVVIIEYDEKEIELTKKIDNKNYYFLHIITNDGKINPMDSNIKVDGDEKSFPGFNQDNIDEMNKFIKQTIEINIYRDLFNLYAYIIESVIEKKLKLPFDYKMSVADDDDSHFRYMNSTKKTDDDGSPFSHIKKNNKNKKNMSTFIVNVPLKRDYAISSRKKDDKMVPTSLCAFPMLEKLLLKMYIQVAKNNVYYSEGARKAIYKEALQAIEKDLIFLSDTLVDYIPIFKNPAPGTKELKNDYYKYSTKMSNYQSKLDVLIASL